MLDTRQVTKEAESNVWDAVSILYKARTDVLLRIIMVTDIEIKKECQNQIDDIDIQVEMLLDNVT